jgi:DNA-binding CsgD family transcriptional regulator
MEPATTAAIDLVEAAYDLEVDAGDWMPRLFAAGRPLFDFASAAYSSLVAGISKEGQPLVTQLHVEMGPEDLVLRSFRAAQEAGPDMVVQTAQAIVDGGVMTLREVGERFPKTYEALTKHIGCKDGIALHGTDPDCRGVFFATFTPDFIELTPREREHWQMLAVHLGAGHRLRRGLESTDLPGIAVSDIPLQAEALLDPSRFLVSNAVGGAKDPDALEKIREAAVRVDRARGKLRKSDPDEALEIWHGLVRGRWSLVDWFDTDGRRFVLAKPNAPNLGDPHGLTEREAQVATYAARGESGKIIGYRFGISPQRVSTLLNAAMRKLRVKTQAQLVEKMRGLPGEPFEGPES